MTNEKKTMKMKTHPLTRTHNMNNGFFIKTYKIQERKEEKKNF